ncbi:hypothetical protein DPX16_2764 [Anabarilius grahami]|uniref:Uncharacterized protein n=1 Tax=Anabarilius grahami TaxID=495550 RepID=A0A3N0XUN3_ANAGA|nr:hypothetical protein DPX16_2764 [Anabarilius grahami]
MQERVRPLHSAMPEEKEKKGESCHHLRYVLSLPSPSTGQGASIPIWKRESEANYKAADGVRERGRGVPHF